MATATERWSDRRLTKSVDGNWTATRAWDVIGYTSEADAVAATGVNPGDSHPRNTPTKCTHIGLTEDKLTLGKVVASYAITSLTNQPENPVDRAPSILWRWSKTSQPIDTDVYGNPILNSANDAFKNHFNRNFSTRFLTIERYEPFYDQEMAKGITDTTNDSSINFLGESFDAGQAYCIGYAPVEKYYVDSPYVKVRYEFEIRTPNFSGLTTLQKRYPFQLRVLDQGQRAQFNAATDGDDPDLHLGHLYLASGEAVTRDVLLSGAGLPIDTSIKVTQGGLNPVDVEVPDEVEVDDESDFGTFLIFIIYPEISFTGIGVEGGS